MHVHSSYDYAIIRVVPSVERGECINVGVILFCRTRRYLGMLIALEEPRLLALSPTLDIDSVRQHLDTLSLICAGDPAAGPISKLSQPERFHWLVSPRSTILQISPVHSGLCSNPEATLRHLQEKLVLVSSHQTSIATREHS